MLYQVSSKMGVADSLCFGTKDVIASELPLTCGYILLEQIVFPISACPKIVELSGAF